MGLRTWRGRTRGRWLLAAGVVFVVAALLVVEHTGTDGVRFAELARQTRSRTARAHAAPAVRPDSQATKSARLDRDAAAAIARANRSGDTAIAEARAAVQAPQSQICALLLSVKARFDATLDAIIARFPAAAPQLREIKRRLDAVLDRLLARFGCRGPSGA